MSPISGQTPIALLPTRGFRNSRPKNKVGLDEMTGASRNWLVPDGMPVPRGGRAVVGDTLSGGVESAGVLESKWGAKARRMVAARLRSQADGYPTPVVLYSDETDKEATLAFLSRNGGSKTWRTVGEEFSSYHYPVAGVPNHRVIPMVYRNEWGGLTLHRLNTERDRRHFAAGSRELAVLDGWLALPNLDGMPVRWNGGFNDATGSGSEVCAVTPLGLIPPLAVPTVTAGADLGEEPESPTASWHPSGWMGQSAFFVTCVGETASGELSPFPMPRACNGNPDWDGYPGFGYIHLDPSNPDHYFATVEWDNIPVLPPEFERILLVRSNQVSVQSADFVGDFPSVRSLYICGIVKNGTTHYSDPNGNDASLTPDSRLQDMWENLHHWPKPARTMGYSDGRFSSGYHRQNPCAIVLAPWKAGLLNLPIDDANLYGQKFFVAVTQDGVVLRELGVADTTWSQDTDLTLRQLVDRINTQTTIVSVTHNCTKSDLYWKHIFTDEDISDVEIGMVAVHPKIPSGVTVVGKDTFLGENRIELSSSVPFGNSFTDEDVIFQKVEALTGGADGDWQSQVVLGARDDAKVSDLLRTRVDGGATWNADEDHITLDDATLAEYITPGMYVYLADGFSDTGMIVTSVNGATIGVTPNTGYGQPTSTDVVFAYDTGDNPASGDVGFVRAFGNCFPGLLFFNPAYLDQYEPLKQDTEFTVASPGYPQGAANTWSVKNGRSGPAVFGPLQGMADLGPVQLRFYAGGRTRLVNTRTGESHVDADYTEEVVSWTHGACSPFLICSGNNWAIFACQDGIFGCGPGGEEVLLSEALYRPGNRAGERGELEYALEESVKAAAGDTDEFKIFGQVIDSRLYVQYHSQAGLSAPDLEVVYDFSAGVGRVGLSALVREDGKPYGWSAPLTWGPSCSCRVVDGDGIHRYAAFDTNAGTADGRVDEVEVGDKDNGSQIVAMAYSGVLVPDAPVQRQMVRVRGTARHNTGSLHVGISRSPHLDEEVAEWDDIGVPKDDGYDFGRFCVKLDSAVRLLREAEQFRYWDDGSGDRAEITSLVVESDVKAAVGITRNG